jgi:hypothetical protein
MKITDLEHGQAQTPAARRNTAGKGEDGGFRRIMEQMGAKPPAAAPEGGPAGAPGAAPVGLPGGVEIVPGLLKTSPAGPDRTRDALLGEIRETLDTVEWYAARLADTSMPAKDMRPLVEHLEGRLESLRSLESSPELPEGLRAVVSELVITIGAETARFGRGDYG